MSEFRRAFNERLTSYERFTHPYIKVYIRVNFGIRDKRRSEKTGDGLLLEKYFLFSCLMLRGEGGREVGGWQP